MLYITALAISSYSGTNNRYLKPFNPLLGETFEFEYPEQGWRGIAEKASSLPVSVFLLHVLIHFDFFLLDAFFLPE